MALPTKNIKNQLFQKISNNENTNKQNELEKGENSAEEIENSGSDSDVCKDVSHRESTNGHR